MIQRTKYTETKITDNGQLANFVSITCHIINQRRVITYRNMTASVEVKGDQSKVNVIHILLKGSSVLGRYEVN